MSTRRDFLRRSAAGALALALPGHLSACTAAGGNRLARIGVQLYTVRSLMQQSVEDTLRSVADIGYNEVEFAGYFGREPAALRATLDTVGLAAPSAHVALAELLPPNAERTLDAAGILGHQFVVVPWLDASVRKTLDDWKRIAAQFNTIGALAREREMQFAYHNHEFEFVPVEGRVPFDVLLEETDASLVQIELDLYWITMAGGDAFAYFERWPGRFPLVHVKDSAGAPQHEQTDVGAGTIPFARLFARSSQAGIQHYFVEQDDPARPLEMLRVSYDHLRELTF